MEKYLLTREEIDACAGVAKTHFINPNAKRINKSLGDLTGLTGIGFHLIEIEPGYESTEMHVHYFEDECIYVLEGEAEALIGDDIFRIKPGDFIGYRAGGKPHQLRNTSNSILKCLVAGQRLDHDVSDYTKLKKRLFRNEGMPWNMVDIDQISEPVAGKKV